MVITDDWFHDCAWLIVIGAALEEKVGQLNKTEKEEMSEVDSTVLQQQVEAMLEQMRNISITNASALTELRSVTVW